MTSPAQTSPAQLELDKRLKRRRTLAGVSAAVAAVGLAGCGIFGGGSHAASAPAAPPADQQEATRRVQSFTSDIERALDNVDQERLRAAAEKEHSAAVVSKTSAAAAANTATPANAVAPANVAASGVAPAAPSASSEITGQSPVILASSAAGSSTAALAVPAPAATPAASGQQKSVGPAAPLASAAGASASVAAAAPPAVSSTVIASPATPAPAPVVVQSAAKAAMSESVASASTPQVTIANNSVVITPMDPVASSSVWAMGSMTAMLTTPVDAGPVVVAAAKPVVAQTPPEPTLEQALAVVRKNVAEHPTLSTSLALALMDNTPAKSAGDDPAQNLSDTDRKIYTDLLAALDAMKTQSGSSAATVADRAAPLIDAGKKWEADADLTLPKLVLASRVDSFGVYTAVDSKFEQGKRHTVIIYCEVANFNAKKGEDGWFTTDLEQQETLITDDGLLLWRPNAEEITDRSMNQRHDFYLVKKLTIPETLAAGKYTLRMSVTDKNASKRSMVSMPIEITGK